MGEYREAEGLLPGPTRPVRPSLLARFLMRRDPGPRGPLPADYWPERWRARSSVQIPEGNPGFIG